jgi:hypothetical protein
MTDVAELAGFGFVLGLQVGNRIPKRNITNDNQNMRLPVTIACKYLQFQDPRTLPPL